MDVPFVVWPNLRTWGRGQGNNMEFNFPRMGLTAYRPRTQHFRLHYLLQNHQGNQQRRGELFMVNLLRSRSPWSKMEIFIVKRKIWQSMIFTLVHWDKWLIDQLSNVPSIIFFSKFLAKFFAMVNETNHLGTPVYYIEDCRISAQLGEKGNS